MMSNAGIPVLAGAVVSSSIDTAAAGREVGYPVLIKASKGGGGTGMRVVREPADLDGAIESSQRQALASFGDATVFLEHFVEKARHVEVQIFGDRHGNVIHIYDRECSVQRRFQKVVEEAPAPFLPDTTRRALWDAAVTAARTVRYVGAGTVEFIVEPDGSFAFLEMNTRLQVEHTVTEETIIIPNSLLVNNTVHNYSYDTRKIFLENTVSVSYSSDLDAVIEILTAIGQDNPYAQAERAPEVRVESFDDSGISIKLRTFINDVSDKFRAHSWTNLTIWRRFRDEGIEIPFPQVDLHIRE